MKITSIKAPTTPFEIIKSGDDDFAVFYDSVEQSKETDGMTGQEIAIWNYEKYMLPVTNSPNLYASIESNLDEWLQKAKDAEQDAEAAKVREYRDNLLSQCDLQHCNPEKWNAMSDAEKLAWAAYKQVLRDIPAQTGFPYSVAWPVLPADTTGVLADSLTANNLVGMQVTSLSLSDAEKSSLVEWLGKQVVQMQLDIAALKGGVS